MKSLHLPLLATAISLALALTTPALADPLGDCEHDMRDFTGGGYPDTRYVLSTLDDTGNPPDRRPGDYNFYLSIAGISGKRINSADMNFSLYSGLTSEKAYGRQLRQLLKEGAALLILNQEEDGARTLMLFIPNANPRKACWHTPPILTEKIYLPFSLQ